MKKTEDYIIEKETDHWADQDYSKSDIIKWIKQAQIDAIEEAVKRCAESANVTDGDSVLEHFYSDYGARIYANIKSILQVGEQLKKELQ